MVVRHQVEPRPGLDFALVGYATGVVVGQEPCQRQCQRQLRRRIGLHSVQRWQRLQREHQPAERKRIVLRALYRDKAPTFGFKAEGRVADLKKAGRGTSRSQ